MSEAQARALYQDRLQALADRNFELAESIKQRLTAAGWDLWS